MGINLAALQELIRGDRLASNRSEELFLLAYKSGIGDELLLYTVLQLKDIFEGLPSEEKDFFILGYCLGQKTFRDVEEESLNFITNSKPNITQ